MARRKSTGKFRYEFIEVRRNSMQSVLDTHAIMGWELVDTVFLTGDGSFLLFFKHPWEESNQADRIVSLTGVGNPVSVEEIKRAIGIKKEEKKDDRTPSVGTEQG